MDPNSINPDGSFKFTKIGKSLEERINFVALLKEQAIKTYENHPLKYQLPLLLIEIEMILITGVIDPEILLAIYMAPSTKKFSDSGPAPKLVFHLPEKFKDKS